MKKKGHDWNNIINSAGPNNAPNTILRSAKNHTPDAYPHGGHVKGWKDENHKERFKRSHPGVGRHDLHKGFVSKPMMGDHPKHSLRGSY